MRKVLTYFLVCSILASCSTSNQVVSNKLFQKRKYKKGWHINSPKKYSKEKSEENNIAETNFEAENDTVISKDVVVNKVSKNPNKSNLKASFQKKKAEIKLKIETITISIPLPNQKVSKSIIPEESSVLSTKTQKENKLLEPIDRSDQFTRVMFALLAIGLLFFFHIGPLSILVGVGKVEAIKTNLIIWLAGFMMLAMALITLLITAGAFLAPVIVMLIIGAGFIVIADIHALIVIIRGY